jgi:hypothetical protein
MSIFIFISRRLPVDTSFRSDREWLLGGDGPRINGLSLEYFRHIRVLVQCDSEPTVAELPIGVVFQ